MSENHQHKALPVEHDSSKYMLLSHHSLEPIPGLPRRWNDPDIVQALAKSMENDGQLNPVLAVPKPFLQGDYQNYWIVDGLGRFKAGKLLGWMSFKTLVIDDIDPLKGFVVANSQRWPVHPITMAFCMAKLKETTGYTDDQLANMFGKKRSTVTQTLTIAKLPKEILESGMCLKPAPSRDALITVARCADSAEQKELWQKVKLGISRSELRQSSRAVSSDSSGIKDLIRKTTDQIRELSQRLIAHGAIDAPQQESDDIKSESIAALTAELWALLAALERWELSLSASRVEYVRGEHSCVGRGGEAMP